MAGISATTLNQSAAPSPRPGEAPITMNTNVPITDHPVYTASGMRISPAEVYARRIAREAEHWLSFATDRTRMKPHTLTRKALGATAFSVQRRASSFAVPSKLVGTSKHQRTLWAMVRGQVAPWTELELDDTGDGLVVRLGDELGEVQSKHLGWLRPLIPFGARLYLSKVTGTDYEGYSLGVNVVVGHVGHALGKLRDALGSAGSSGDGHRGAVPAVSETSRTPLRLVIRPEHEALTGDPDDVVLFRRVDGTACATVPHVVRHSPTGIAWGFAGSGPADLARSVLLALTDEATAERFYQAFKAEVVVRVPHAGGVLRATEVRAWVEAQSDRPTAA